MAEGFRMLRGKAIADLAGTAACLLLALSAGCGAYRVPRVEPLGPVPVRHALGEARDHNWRVRVFLPDTTLAGRAAFVTDTSVRIAETTVRLADIRQLDRWARADLGGRPAGAFVGAGLGMLLGSLNRGFWQFGYERPCNGSCALGIFVPWIAGSTLAGTMIGSAVHPPRGRWTTVWTRP
ncbi:MAG TPA: hypothetical protein VF832_01995 [Longimicrobiales bacterium]